MVLEGQSEITKIRISLNKLEDILNLGAKDSCDESIQLALKADAQGFGEYLGGGLSDLPELRDFSRQLESEISHALKIRPHMSIFDVKRIALKVASKVLRVKSLDSELEKRALATMCVSAQDLLKNV